jgi:hypothetical protein
MAQLDRSVKRQKKRRPGALKGKIKIAKDFDELSEDVAGPWG